VHIIKIGKKLYLEENVEAGGDLCDIALLDEWGDYRLPDAHSVNDMGDTLVYFEIVEGEELSVLRVRLEYDEKVETERVLLDRFRVIWEEGLPKFEMRMMLDSSIFTDLTVEHINLIERYADKNISANPSMKGQYKDFSRQYSEDWGEMERVKSSEYEERFVELEDLGVKVHNTSTGTRVTISLSRSPYSRESAKSRTIRAIMDALDLRVITHVITENDDGFTVEVPENISFIKIRDSFPV